MQYTVDVNAYVEEQSGYSSDHVTVNFNETTNEVTAYISDESGNQVAGSSNLVDVTFTGTSAAVNALGFYQQIIADLAQGDVIRHYDNKQITMRDPGNQDANRYPSF